jgi:hypothetical protein
MVCGMVWTVSLHGTPLSVKAYVSFDYLGDAMTAADSSVSAFLSTTGSGVG